MGNTAGRDNNEIYMLEIGLGVMDGGSTIFY
jgi:hypothetical protein